MDELDNLRAEMDRINLALRDLLQQRARLAADIADYKRTHGLAMVDTVREAAMLARVVADAPAGFAPDVLAGLFQAILAASRDVVVSRGEPVGRVR